MLLSLTLALLQRSPSAATDLEQVRRSYAGLKSYTATIKSHGRTVLYGCEAKLWWKKGNRFRIELHQPGVARPVRVYACDGKTVTRFPERGSAKSVTFPLAYKAGTIPDWEAEGGMVLSWLLDSNFAQRMAGELRKNPKDFQYGARKFWQGLNVIEVQFLVRGTVNSSVMLSPDKKSFIGAVRGENWTQYVNTKSTRD